MEINEAKRLVIEAGEKLVAEGLIARTWGNVSCRVDENTFVITPSGKPYIGLKPEDIVEIAIEDLAWSGDVKPSSEKGVHAEVYKLYPEANFVIHTHQQVASVVSALKDGITNITGEAAKVLGKEVLIASHGLPGTKKLINGVSTALKFTDSKAVIMAHHGALCFGADFTEAFDVAAKLEEYCTQYILDGAKAKFGIVAANLDEFSDKIISRIAKATYGGVEKKDTYNSSIDRDNGTITLTNNVDGTEVEMDLRTGATTDEVTDLAEAHRQIYLRSKNAEYIIHNTDKPTVAVSTMGKTMKPLVDDFSQICGITVKCAKDAVQCGKKIKGRNAVLLKNKGAFCTGAVESDTQAVDMIMTKSALAELATKVYEPSKPISPVNALLERVVYTLKYSKQANK